MTHNVTKKPTASGMQGDIMEPTGLLGPNAVIVYAEADLENVEAHMVTDDACNEDAEACNAADDAL